MTYKTKKPRPRTRKYEALHREVFAAAFVRDFFEAKEVFSFDPRMMQGHDVKVAAQYGIRPEDVSPFDCAVAVTTGERAWTVADAAVEAYEKWAKENRNR